MKTITLIACFAAAAITGCATPYHQTPTQPTAKPAQPTAQLTEPQACAQISTLFTQIHESAIQLGENCLRSDPDSQECAVFKYGLQKIYDSEIQQALVYCLSTGNITEAQSRAARHMPVIDHVTAVIEQVAAREKTIKF